VLNLEIRNGRCTGARIHKDSEVTTVSAGETVLCAGAIDSPRVLMLSGIGKSDELAALGIKVKNNLPGVGRNLHDHMLTGLVYRPKRELPLSKFNHADSILYFDSDGSGVPDLLIMCVTHKKFATEETGAVPENAFSLVAALMSPASRGSVTLTSNDPREPVRIDPRAFAEDSDMKVYLHAVEVARELGNSRALGAWRAAELLPRKQADGRVNLKEFARDATTAFFHPVGTCRMGADADAVVDHQLRVRGVDALRIVDASVIPVIPDALPHAAILAIAEKAADDLTR
jgi:choline dehydrogenase